MSFSLLFVPPEQRTQPSLAKVYHSVVEEKIRSRIVLPNPLVEKKAKSLGRLFDTSVDDPAVLARVRKGDRKATEKPNNIVDTYIPIEKHSLKHIHPPSASCKASPSKHILPISNTIQTLNSSPGGKFHIPNVANEYERRILGGPSQSAFNINTPKMWPSEEQYVSTSAKASQSFDYSLASTFGTNTFGRKSTSANKKKQLTSAGSPPLAPLLSNRPCSKQSPLNNSSIASGNVVVHNGSVSELQQTLSQCGKLTLVDSKTLEKQSAIVKRSVKHHAKNLQKHVDWLKQGFHERESWHHHDGVGASNGAEFEGNEDAGNSSMSVHTKSTMSQSANDSWLQLNPSSSQLKSLKKGSNGFEDQQGLYLTSLNVQSFSNSLNPFRQAHGGHGNVAYSRSVPKVVRAQDNMDYKDDLFVKTISSFNACIEPNFDIHKVPSKKEVSNAIFQLTRKQIVVYHTRIVEIGSIIRAFRDSKHPTPGLQGIFVLHHAFVSSTALCTNPYILSRKQMYSIIESQVPWANGESISRLLLAFDNTNTGFIRYVRLSCALIACLEPAMANLAASLDHTDVKAWNAMACAFSKTKKSNFVAYSEAEMKDLKGELVVIRFLHKMYSECNGYLDQSVQSTAVPMMQLQDIPELFSCCSCSPEDDRQIASLVQVLLQEIYDTVTQRGTLPGTSPIKVGALMKFQELRTEFGLLSVSSDVLLECVIKFPDFFREFVRQMRAYRAAAHPYIYNMSMSIEDSISRFSQSQKSMTRAS